MDEAAARALLEGCLNVLNNELLDVNSQIAQLKERAFQILVTEAAYKRAGMDVESRIFELRQAGEVLLSRRNTLEEKIEAVKQYANQPDLKQLERISWTAQSVVGEFGHEAQNS